MKRILKSEHSLIIQQNLKYPKDRSKIREILEKEQGGFCAYTENRITAAFAVDVEHFNPTLKNTIHDNYTNWFAVGHKWNIKKSDKWEKFLPILHPTDPTFEDRIRYDIPSGTYKANVTDSEALNLINLLDLNDYQLSQERRAYIQNIKKSPFSELELIEWYKTSNQIQFRRAIETAFNIKL